jgi:NADH-quinone oxidoreductase subunit N
MVSKDFLLKKYNNDTIEFSFLIGFSLFFMFILLSSINIITAFISLEGLTMVIYILSIFPFKKYNFEATIKYFYLSAIGSSILLFSLSLIYGLVGSCNYFAIKYHIYQSFVSLINIFNIQFIILAIIFSFLFKIGAFPLHWWVPDTYESVWLFTTAFFMVVTKMVFFFFFVRFIMYFFFSLSAI